MAKITADPTGGVTIGIDHACYALMTKDDGIGIAPVYGDVVMLPNAKSVQIESSDSIQTEYYDNKPMVITNSKSDKRLTFVKSDFSSEDLASFMGCKIKNGILVESGDDVSPYIAFGFRTLTTKGHRYYWLLKGRMTAPGINAASQEQTVTFQNQTITGVFASRACDSAIRIQKDVDGEDDTEAAATAWFSSETLTALYSTAD